MKDHFAERIKVRPGITGPWQIHGRSDIPFEDMVKLDYTYVASWSHARGPAALWRAPPARSLGAVAPTRRAAAAVDERGFRAPLRRRTSGRVYGFFGYRLGSRAEAEDLTQPTSSARCGLAPLRPERASARTWLMAIAHNLLIDHYRRERPGTPAADRRCRRGAARIRGARRAGARTGARARGGPGPLGRSRARADRAAIRRRSQRPRDRRADRPHPANVQQILSRSLRRLRTELEAREDAASAPVGSPRPQEAKGPAPASPTAAIAAASRPSRRRPRSGAAAGAAARRAVAAGARACAAARRGSRAPGRGARPRGVLGRSRSRWFSVSC